MAPLRVVALLAALSCASYLDVDVVQSPSADLARYRTFALHAGAPPTDFVTGDRARYVEGRVEQLARPLLEQKGWAEAAVGTAPDLTIRVSTGRREQVSWKTDYSAPRYCRTKCIVREETYRGALVIDAFDTASQELVWHGGVVVDIERDRIDEERLAHVVAAVLASFPKR